jgi:hypothetical protein
MNLVCAHCGQPITSDDDMELVNLGTRERYDNAAGYRMVDRLAPVHLRCLEP